MKIISFAWTTPALLAGRKTVTRRTWTPGYAAGFEAGDMVQAYDKSPRNGGRRVAIILLTADPDWAPMRLIPDADYEAEGFRFYEEYPEMMPLAAPWPSMDWDVFNAWRSQPTSMYVVRFKVVAAEATTGIGG